MPKVVDHDQRRELLAITAGKLVAEQGVAKATIRGVARAADVSTGTVSHYYRDSRELLFAAYQQAFKTSGDRFVDKLNANTSFDGLLKAIAGALPSSPVALSEWKVRMAFWGISDYAEEILAFEQVASEQFRKLIIKRLKTLEDKGAIQLATSTAHAARTIEGLLAGTAIQSLLSPGIESHAVAQRRMCEQIRRGVLEQ
jgi:AcrR family transcriptional regulator